jgi:hypothetical protein
LVSLSAYGFDAVCYVRQSNTSLHEPLITFYGNTFKEKLFASFQMGNSSIKRVLEGSAKFEISLMCSEKEPLDCHRTLLVSQSLSDLGAQVVHIHADGKIESQADVLNRLLRNYNLDSPDLFGAETDRLQEAISKQEKKIAYTDEQMSEG